MDYQIICPYCFEEMQDDEVLFRSEVVNQGEPDILPDDYDDLDDFQARYRGNDKEEILVKYQDWMFFEEAEDQKYEAFWSKFNGTTEYNPADDLLGVKAYRRRVIDPMDSGHQRYLKKQNDDSFFISDGNGMVTQIELVSGDKCHRRVCRHCHNPLPDNYGKNTVKFATVIGITGAGKTVYLSQLLRKIKTYSAKVGLNAIVTAPSTANFVANNRVADLEALPGSTPATRFQQPLFYEMVRDAKEHGRITETFVLYDVAGEVFKESTLINKFAPFIEHADGVIVLIDPYQFEAISGASKGGKVLDDPTTVLNVIHNIVSHGVSNVKCTIPFAVCMSKADDIAVQMVFSDALKSMLLNDVNGVLMPNSRLCATVFNAKEYSPIADELSDFLLAHEDTRVLAQQMETNYSSYAYFALTALGCDVTEMERDNGEKYQAPVGPVLPKRVEEPLLWLFYKLGYIGKNAPLSGEINCPECGSSNNYELPEDERSITVRRGLFRREEIYVNRCCTDCDYRWEC